MQQKNSVTAEFFRSGIFRKGEIPYQVENLFYESFGMSSDEVFEALKDSDFFEMN